MDPIRTPLLSLSSVPALSPQEEKISIFKTLKITLWHGAKRALSFFSCGCYRYSKKQQFSTVLPVPAAVLDQPICVRPYQPRPTQLCNELEAKILAHLAARINVATKGADTVDGMVDIDIKYLHVEPHLERYQERIKNIFSEIREDCELSGPFDQSATFYSSLFALYAEICQRVDTDQIEETQEEQALSRQLDINILPSDSQCKSMELYRDSISEGFDSVFKSSLWRYAGFGFDPIMSEASHNGLTKTGRQIFEMHRSLSNCQAVYSRPLTHDENLESRKRLDEAFSKQTALLPNAQQFRLLDLCLAQQWADTGPYGDEGQAFSAADLLAKTAKDLIDEINEKKKCQKSHLNGSDAPVENVLPAS